MERMAEARLPDPAEYFIRVMPGLERWDDGDLKRNVWRKRMLELTDLYHVGRGNRGETVWDAYNAVTEWVDHTKKTGNWVECTQFGGGDALKREAFTVAVDMAETSRQPRISIPVALN